MLLFMNSASLILWEIPCLVELAKEANNQLQWVLLINISNPKIALINLYHGINTVIVDDGESDIYSTKASQNPMLAYIYRFNCDLSA